MTLYRQHIPNFIEGVTPDEASFNSIEDLMLVPSVKRWREHPGFVRLTSHEACDGRWRYHLMAEMKDGKFWVVGFLDCAVDLPEWRLGVTDGQKER